MPSRRPFAVLLAAAALFLGACGDAEEKNAYVDKVQAAQRDYADEFGSVLRRLRPTSTLDQDRATFASFEKATTQFETTLRGVTPPGKVADEHRALVSAVTRFGQELTAARDGLAGGSKAARAQVRTDLSSSAAETQRRLARAVADVNAGLQEG